jgi:flagellar biosynthesis chaperone FliJ
MNVGITDVVRAAQGGGFYVGGGLINAVAVSCAENNAHNTTAVYVNTDGSRDRGLWQINDRWHPEVTDECAFDPLCSAKAAFVISSRGTNFTPWATWQSGAYKPFLELARTAIDLVIAQDNNAVLRQQIGALQSQIDALGAQIAALQAEIASLEAGADSAALLAQITDLQAQVASLGSQVSSLQAQLTEAQQNIATALANVQAASKKLTTARAALIENSATATTALALGPKQMRTALENIKAESDSALQQT